MFNENEHPRDDSGKFAKKDGGEITEQSEKAKSTETAVKELQGLSAEQAKQKILSKQSAEDKSTSMKKVVKIDMNADVQKRLNAAKTAKERQQIAFRYIMDNLRGQYEALDGRTVAIERVGADKMTYRDNKDKLRVCPALADMIKAGEYDHSAPAEEKANKKFEEFAYYKVSVKMGEEVYTGMLNVGIRKDGSSTLYDLRPFHKEDK